MSKKYVTKGRRKRRQKWRKKWRKNLSQFFTSFFTPFLTSFFTQFFTSSFSIGRRKKFGLFRRNNSKQRSESTTRCRFWSTVSKRGTHFDNSFLIVKCSCKKRAHCRMISLRFQRSDAILIYGFRKRFGGLFLWFPV